MIFVLKNPVYGRGKLIEKERSRMKTKWQVGVYVIFLFPTYSKKDPVLWSYWDKAESIFMSILAISAPFSNELTIAKASSTEQ